MAKHTSSERGVHGPARRTELPYDPLSDVRRLKRLVRFGVFFVITADLPVYPLLFGYSLEQTIAVALIGWLIAFAAIESAFWQVFKLRKETAYPNLLLTELSRSADISGAARTAVDTVSLLLRAPAVVLALRPASPESRSEALSVAASTLPPDRAAELLAKLNAEAQAAQAESRPVALQLLAGREFHPAFGLVPVGCDRIVVVPLAALHGPIGALILAGQSGKSDLGDERLLTAVGSALGLSLENIQQKVELIEGRERLATVVAGAPVIIFATDRDGAITFLEGHALKSLNPNPERLIGRSVFDIFADRPEMIAQYKKAFSGEQVTTVAEVGGRMLEAHIKPVFGPRGEVNGLIGVATDITSRLEAERALAASEERLRKVVTNMPVVLFALDREGVFTLSEGLGLRSLNLTSAEVVGKSVFEIYGETSRIADNVRRALSGAAFTDTVPAGGRYWETSYSPLLDPDGSVAGVIGVAFDVTERVQAEEQLRASEERYRALVENANDIVFAHDMEGRFLSVNEAARRILGYSPEELLSMSVSDVVSPEFLDLADEMMRVKLERGGRTVYELCVRDKQGNDVPLEVSTWLVRDAAGAPVAVHGIARDITERRRAEQALRESEERYRELFERASDLIYVHDMNGRFLAFNDAACRITGYSREELLAMNAGQLVAKEYHAVAAEMARRAFNGEFAVAELEIVGKGGRRISLEVSPRLVMEGGRPVAVQGIARDITYRKRVDAALRALAAEESGEEFFHSMVRQLAAALDMKFALAGQLLDDRRAYTVAFWTGEGFAEPFEYELTGTPCENVVGREMAHYPAGVQALFPHHPYLPQFGIESYLGIPLFDSAGKPIGVLAVMHDEPREVTEADKSILAVFAARAGAEMERKRTEEALRRSEERYRSLFEMTRDVIFAITLDGTITELNPAFEELTGWKREQWLGKNFAPLIHPDDLPQIAEIMKQLAAGHVPKTVAYEWRVMRKDGGYMVGEFVPTPLYENGQLAGVLGTVRDVTERNRAEQTIRQLAYHDALTGLPNRALFADRLRIALAQAARRREMLAVMFLDLDRFKVVNDTLGHSGGDTLLKLAAEQLSALVRDGDTVARVGGDEFILLLPAIKGEEEAQQVAERILAALRQPFTVSGQEFTVTTSIGITLFPRDGEDAETLLRNADTAMYRAKERGRDTYEFFSPSLNATVIYRLALESDLRHALDRGQFRLYYQPIAETAGGRLVGAEALLRWAHPDRGIVRPDEFIPFAEESGLIVPMGQWVLDEALRQAAEWQALKGQPARIAINISARQLQQEDFVQVVRRALEKSGLPPAVLQLEITEGAVMRNLESAIRMLNELREMGVGISIDDFGTGYSSLSYLKRFPIDSVKIDRSFVRDVVNNPNDAAIVTTVIAMARNLNLRVIAEGVETEEQLEFLRRRGCDEYQGYLLGRPAPAEKLRGLLLPADGSARRRPGLARVKTA